MIAETRIERLEAKLHQMRRAIAALAGLLIAGLACAAMQQAGQISRGTFTVTDVEGKPTGTVLRDNGDVTIGGKLLVQSVNVAAELQAIRAALSKEGNQLQVAEIPVSLIDIPITNIKAIHAFWGLTRKGESRPPITADLNDNPDRAFVNLAAEKSEEFGDEILTSWITPTNGMHECVGEAQIMRLETVKVGKNKIVIAASCVGQHPAKWLNAKVVILYRGKPNQ